MERMKTRQRRGEALLTARDPHWYRLVDPDRLEMANTTLCVLGQWADDYAVGCARLGLERPRRYAEVAGRTITWVPSALWYDETEPVRHGFNLDTDGLSLRRWQKLNRLWAARVRELRDGDVGEPVRRITIEPLPETAPAEEPATPEPARESVPA
jgi:hypothetical protein